MDDTKYLIIIGEKDKTNEITNYDDNQTHISIYFNSSKKPYDYNASKVSIYKDPKNIPPNSCRVFLRNQPLNNIVKILDFESYIKVFYVNGKKPSYKKTELYFEYNALDKENSKYIFNYLKLLAKSINNEEVDFLAHQYEKMDYVNENSVLAKYLSQEKSNIRNSFSKVKIFPFGLNLSQKDAVTKALNNQVSIIEGPPGTGKTQTILNIIANLLIDNKTMAVVSSNNSAIQNVYDKLNTYNLSFFVALLGNKENQDAFFVNQKDTYPSFSQNEFNNKSSRKAVEKNINNIKKMLQINNDLANVSKKLEELKLEKKYFMDRYDARDIDLSHYEKVFLNKDIDTILHFLAEVEFLNIKKKMTFLFKIKALIKYKVLSLSLYKYPLNDIVLLLQKCLYEVRIKEFENDILTKKTILDNASFEKIIKQYTTESMGLLELHLSKKYDITKKRHLFKKDILWKKFDAFTKEYPVILSTTHALKNCTGKDFLYDYLIIDEASQVDIVTGSLALSCAKNVVIVGDQKQLPHVVKNETEIIINKIFSEHTLNQYYHYNHSLLSSASKLFITAPKTLLKEHYRCHPKIIDFCNKKFYDNQLIILSKEGNIKEPLVLINTAKGNHARCNSNQRQIDVIENEIIPHLSIDDLGIISPFRDQVTKLSTTIKSKKGLQIDTVHKYQGREKNIIILTTVVDKKNKFADNPNLLNVAISRAKNQLYVVVSDREKNKNMKDLVNYIKYNNFNIIESKIYSIFDLLYKSYAPYLEKYLVKLKNSSGYLSENLMNILIEDVLSLEQYSYLSHISNYPLHKLIKDTSILSKKEFAFVHSSAHIDFMIYNSIHKKVVLAVEVDGFAYHENNPSQLKRDALKDQILNKYSIPIIRFPTNGSEEKKKLIKKLKELLN